MRAILLTAAALVGLTSLAQAADLPVKAAPVAVRPACAQFGGFYIGGHGGFNYYRNDWTDRDNFGFNFTSQDHVGDGSLNNWGWHAGGQAGWNWQSGCTVFGVQVDGSWTNATADRFYTDGAPTTSGANTFFPGTLNASSKVEWFGTARTKAGVVVDNLLLYVTGGFAWANFQRNMVYTSSFITGANATAANSLALNTSNYRWGWAVGAGTEWSFTPNWSLFSEFMYMGFQKDTQGFACTAVANCANRPVGTISNFEFNDTMWVTRWGVNYRFGGNLGL